MSGWVTRTIGETCTIVNGATPKTAIADYWGGQHQWVTPAEMGKRPSPYIRETERTLTDVGLENCSASLIPPHSVILSSRAPIGHLVINTVPMAFNQGCKGIVPKAGMYYKYLYYFLHANVELLNALGTGATFKELSAGKLKDVPIPVPSLAEQKQIVAILDEAFTGIAKVTGNAECNVANARELLQTIVDAGLCATEDSAENVTLDELREKQRVITYGVIKLGDHIEGGVPCLRTSNVRWLNIDTAGMKCITPELSQNYKRTILKGGEVLVNVRGTLGGVAVVDNDMRGWNISREVAMVPVDQQRANPRYLAYWIARTQSQAWLTGVLTGAAYTGINIEDLRTLPISLPDMREQCRAVNALDELMQSARVLKREYESRLSMMSELQDSLLHKAFSGQLTSKAVVPGMSLADTTSPAYTADILALGYSKHKAANRDRTYGRVKGQKVLHLVESIGGLELGRVPIKDAAGPNDSAHMRKAESWAADNDYFIFIQRSGGGYDFVKGKAFDRLYAGAHARLAAHRAEIERIVDLLLPMDSKEAEVFTTTHAAWNNLLLDGEQPTDAKILHEARENWHASKLNIPRSKFSDALRRIRAERIAPTGCGKRVGGQESLL